jgi:hypothetical protein
VTVPAGTEVEEECLGDGTGQEAFNAAITAIRITSSSMGTVPTALPHHIMPGLRKNSPVSGPPKS